MVENEANIAEAEPPIKLFGDPRSPLVERGPDRRTISAGPSEPVSRSVALEQPGVRRYSEPGHALRSGRGDAVSTGLAVLAVLVFAATVIAGSLILYNAKTVGAFSNPWDSTRVAIGVTVLAVGIVQSALLIGVSRAIAYLLGGLRLRERDLEAQNRARSGPDGHD